MADNFDLAKGLFKLNERVFAISGVWPLKFTYAKFSVWLLYIVIHICSSLAELYDGFGDLDRMIPNIVESSWYMMLMLKMLVMRFSRRLMLLTERVIDGVDAKFFESPEEKKMYLNYNVIAKSFFNLWLIIGILVSLSYHLRPLKRLFTAGSRNESTPFILPYHTRLFFEVNDFTTYWLVWIYQLPLMYLNTYQTATIGYLFSLILHVCGLTSVLSLRIKNVGWNSRENDESSKVLFQDIVGRHRNILEMTEDINEVFGFLLLEELIISIIIVSISCYNLIMNVASQNTAELLVSILDAATVILSIYGYCLAGEYLINENANLYGAYYQSQWYDMPESFKKPLIICMIGAGKPIQLNGCGVYIFSMASFMSVRMIVVTTERSDFAIVKTSAGYISMLRTMIQT